MRGWTGDDVVYAPHEGQADVTIHQPTVRPGEPIDCDVPGCGAGARGRRGHRVSIGVIVSLTGPAPRSAFRPTTPSSSGPPNSAVRRSTCWCSIPVALKKGKPGTGEFRLRDAIEGLEEVVGAQGVFNLSDKDHNGVDARSQVMVKVECGQWKLVK